MAAPLVLSNLTRTLSTFFRIGTIRIKDNAGVVNLRDANDTAFVDAVLSKIHIRGSNPSNGVVLSAPNSMSSVVTLVLPGNVGATGEFLRSGGDGTMSWASPQASADQTEGFDFTQGTTSPATIFTPPANAIIKNIMVEVTVAAASGSPTIKVGTASDDDAYVLATDVDLKTVAMYEVRPAMSVGETPEPVIITITPSAQVFSGKVYITYTIPS